MWWESLTKIWEIEKFLYHPGHRNWWRTIIEGGAGKMEQPHLQMFVPESVRRENDCITAFELNKMQSCCFKYTNVNIKYNLVLIPEYIIVKEKSIHSWWLVKCWSRPDWYVPCMLPDNKHVSLQETVWRRCVIPDLGYTMMEGQEVSGKETRSAPRRLKLKSRLWHLHILKVFISLCSAGPPFPSNSNKHSKQVYFIDFHHRRQASNCIIWHQGELNNYE